MWHAAINSHGKFLSAANPDEFANALSEILRSIGARESAEGGSAVSSVTLETQSAKYIPTYKNSSWAGDVQAKRVDINGSAIADLWRASEHVPSPNTRNIWLSSGGAAPSVPFDLTNVIASGQADASVDADMIAYMRGDRTTGEGTKFRARDPKTVLGDMINSIPTLIGSLVDEQYQFLPETASTAAARNSYRGFINYKKGRQRVLFVGANDGKLHGFNADTGVEEYAFVPEGVVQKLHLPADINYSHQYMVDGPLAEVDIYKGTWKNYLLGSLGAGGRSVFALDVTDTANLGGATAKWEYSDPELGYVVAPMSAGLTESGHWIAVTGNGMDSNSGNASMHVIDMYTGNRLRKLTVPAGGSNGLGGVRLVKDINNIVVAAYAGDQKGNIWRFDMTGGSPNDWAVGFGGAPLFTSAGGALQPIIGQPEYIDHPKGGQLVVFGTGRLYNEADITGATSGQRAYGVWDKTAGNETSVAGDQIPNGAPLQAQSFGGTTGTTPVSYQSSAHAVNYDTQWGWYLDLDLAAGQRSIYSPQLVRGFILFNTIAPGPDTGEPCDDSLALGYNVLVNALTGGASSKPLIDTDGDGDIDPDDSPGVSTYETVADGIDRIMLGTNGTVSLQRAFGQTTVNIQGRGLERIWRILMNPPG
jgi:type IV pilus assembly protein PilY1